jgi:hypothetical protein
VTPDAIEAVTLLYPSICAGLEAQPNYLKRLRENLNGKTNVVKVHRFLANEKALLLRKEKLEENTRILLVVRQSPC